MRLPPVRQTAHASQALNNRGCDRSTKTRTGPALRGGIQATQNAGVCFYEWRRRWKNECSCGEGLVNVGFLPICGPRISFTQDPHANLAAQRLGNYRAVAGSQIGGMCETERAVSRTRKQTPFQSGPDARLVASDQRRTSVTRHVPLNPIRFSDESQWIQSRSCWLSCSAFVLPVDIVATRCFRRECAMDFSKMAG